MKTRTGKKMLTAGLLMLAVAFVTMSFDNKNHKPWNAPASAKATKNPLAGGAEVIAAGKTLYIKHCKSCHGIKGLGDGPKAKELDTDSGNFSTKEFQAQTDGELFYKIKEGRSDMPSFKKKITDEKDLWSIVKYIRTL